MRRALGEHGAVAPHRREQAVFVLARFRCGRRVEGLVRILMRRDRRRMMRDVDELAMLTPDMVDGNQVGEARELSEQRERCQRDRGKP